MDIEVLADPDAVARRAAALIAAAARDSRRRTRRFVLAVSGGRTPWIMLKMLAEQENVPWRDVHVVQVDERIAPEGDADRNLTHLRASLLERAPLPRPRSCDAGGRRRSKGRGRALRDDTSRGSGMPPDFDLVHLGLGVDGDIALLIPDDAVLGCLTLTVALTDVYQGRRRMTLTYP